jgi:predicted nucleotidyltransferase
MFGLKNEDIEEITRILKQFTVVEEAFICGSRAMGTYRRGSDIDIALKGKNLHPDIIREISFLLNEETIMPYHFDILNYHSLTNQDLIEHIDRAGAIFYNRREANILNEKHGDYSKKAKD